MGDVRILGKIIWIKCDTICLKKEVGGLEVKRIKEFNVALFGNGVGG